MAVWLLLESHSMTSLVCLLLGLLLWWGGGYLARLRSPLQVVRRVLAIGLCLVAVAGHFSPFQRLFLRPLAATRA